jgi:hypothetical protein
MFGLANRIKHPGDNVAGCDSCPRRAAGTSGFRKGGLSPSWLILPPAAYAAVTGGDNGVKSPMGDAAVTRPASFSGAFRPNSPSARAAVTNHTHQKLSKTIVQFLNVSEHAHAHGADGLRGWSMQCPASVQGCTGRVCVPGGGRH